MALLKIKRHKQTNMIHVYRDYGFKSDLVGIYYFKQDATRDYPQALDFSNDGDL